MGYGITSAVGLRPFKRALPMVGIVTDHPMFKWNQGGLVITPTVGSNRKLYVNVFTEINVIEGTTITLLLTGYVKWNSQCG